MNEYSRIVRRVSGRLTPLDRAREEVLKTARTVVRSASALIRGLHRGHWDSAAARRMAADRGRLARLVQNHSRFAAHGAVLQAQGEAAEAVLLRAFLDGRKPPTPERAGVPPEAYLLGLADFVGELRRVVLSRLLQDDVDGARRAFESMEKAYEALVDGAPPEGVLALRAKLDALRALVERTRGDLVTAKKAKQLENKIDGVGRLLEEAEGTRPHRRPAKSDDELDLDAAWGKA